MFWSVAALFVVVLSTAHVAAHSLLLVFAGILFGTGLRGLAEFVSKKLRISVGCALATCLALMLVIVAGCAAWILPNVVQQSAMLGRELHHAYDGLRQSVAGAPFSGKLAPDATTLSQKLGQFASGLFGVLSTAVGAAGSALFVAFAALFLATNPGIYRRGMLAVVPPGGRQRAAEILDALASALRRWLLGRAVSMTAVGLVTTAGLWVLGVPFPVALGLLAGLLGFVPNVGPLVSAVPALLLAFMVSQLHVLYVALLYVAVNLADGYGLTPWIQRRAVSLPPLLVITGQLVLGVVWGALGLTLATPILACLLVLTRRLYLPRVERQEPKPGAANP